MHSVILLWVQLPSAPPTLPPANPLVPLQIAGVVITSVAVTCYAGSQWWLSRRQQRAALAQQQQRQLEVQQQGEAADAAESAGGK